MFFRKDLNLGNRKSESTSPLSFHSSIQNKKATLLRVHFPKRLLFDTLLVSVVLLYLFLFTL